MVQYFSLQAALCAFAPPAAALLSPLPLCAFAPPPPPRCCPRCSTAPFAPPPPRCSTAAALLDAVASDLGPVRLQRGCRGSMPYPRSDLFHVGSPPQRVSVEHLDEVDAGVRPVGHCANVWTVPRCVVLLPATGVGVLAQAAARAGATRFVKGLVSRGVHIGVADTEDNNLLHAALQEGHEACALQLLDLGAVDHPRAINRQAQSTYLLSKVHGFHQVIRKLATTYS